MNKLFLRLLVACATVKLAHGATITVSAGFNSATAITLRPAVINNFTVAVGSWDGNTFTQFGSSIIDSGSINGSFTATAPAEVNGDVIHVWVGIGPVTTQNEGVWALLRTSINTAFPADVSSILASATVNMHNSTPGTVIYVTGSGFVLEGNELTIPEPSCLLLGMLGGIALLRRRR